jgi:branched-chain amino acid transport system permease protein
MMRRSRVLLFAAAIAAPLVFGNAANTVYLLFLLSATVVTGLCLLYGYAGQLSLGQGAFYGAGAYTAAALAVHGVPPLAALACAPLLAGLTALIAGAPLLRLRGHYLAFGTLAVQLAFTALAASAGWLGGSLGLAGIPPFSVGSWQLTSPRAYAWLALAVLAAVLLITRNVVGSRPGRGLRALAGGEFAAAACGVPVGRYRLTAFVIAAMFAGLAGAMYAFFVGYLAPDSFPLVTSVEYVAMTVVGGTGCLAGAVLGTACLTGLTQLLSYIATQPGLPRETPAVLSYAGYAVTLIVVVRFLPRGLISVPHMIRSTRMQIDPSAPGDKPETAQMVVVHKAMQREFGLLPDLVAATPAAGTTRARIVAEHMKLMCLFLDEHHGSEDRFLWPLLRQRAPMAAELVTTMEAQHQEVHHLLKAVEEDMTIWAEAAAAQVRDRLAGHLARLRDALTEHLDIEETAVLPLIHRYLTVPEWLAPQKAAGAALPRSFRIRMVLAGTILEDATPRERAWFLHELPAPVRPLWHLAGTRIYAAHTRTVRRMNPKDNS